MKNQVKVLGLVYIITGKFMPHPTKKSVHAKTQCHKGENNFISLQQSDAASEHVPSSTELSSDEFENHLYQVPLQTTRKWQLVSKAPYTGDSHATKFQRQSYGKKASSDCRNISSFFQVSPVTTSKRSYSDSQLN